MPLRHVHLLTCEARKTTCMETLGRWACTDAPAPPRVHYDPIGEKKAPRWGTPARVVRLTEAFGFMLRAVAKEMGADSDWLLFLEDDLDFHPRLARHATAWAALQDKNCRLASLFNSGVRPRAVPNPPAYSFAALADSYIGSQALFLRRAAVHEAVRCWDALAGLQCQRLARLFGTKNPLWVHKPSLVQHVAEDSSWGVPVKRAMDFDPAWEPGSPRPSTGRGKPEEPAC